MGRNKEMKKSEEISKNGPKSGGSIGRQEDIAWVNFLVWLKMHLKDVVTSLHKNF